MTDTPRADGPLLGTADTQPGAMERRIYDLASKYTGDDWEEDYEGLFFDLKQSAREQDALTAELVNHLMILTELHQCDSTPHVGCKHCAGLCTCIKDAREVWSKARVPSCRHCGKPESHPVGALDICPEHEAFIADTTPAQTIYDGLRVPRRAP